MSTDVQVTEPKRAVSSGGRRLLRGLGTGSALAAAAVILAACGSSSPSAGNTGGSTTSSLPTPSSSVTGPTGPTGPTGSTTSSTAVAAASLSETGSSLLYPLFSKWAIGYHTAYPSVTINAVETSSCVGISSATSGTVNIGASDAYLPPADFTTYSGVEDVPLAISSQNVDYNLPSLPKTTHLKLNGTILADMYTGKITNWNDSAIAAINPGVKLPDLAVHTVHRSDSSGDTFLFTTYLTDAAPSVWTLGYNTQISFPNVTNSQGALKNSGMLSACSSTPGCVAYIGISYLQKAQAAGLGQAELENKAGDYVAAAPASISAEATGCPPVPANGSASLIDCSTSADSYPIVNFEYAIVLPSKLSSSDAGAVKALLGWITNPADGDSAAYLTPVNFVPLTPGALTVAQALIATI
jgi:phosphate transport system substrate-binding protein